MRPRRLWGLGLLLAATQLLYKLPVVNGQGLNDGGLLGGQTCDAARLAQFDELLALADEYAGGKGGGGKGGSGGGRGGRGRGGGSRHLAGLADEPPPGAADEVQAAGAPSWRTNQTCTSTNSVDNEAAFHVASAPAVYLAATPTVHDQGEDECASCVGFALASCAEASLAAFTGTSPTDVAFSPRSLYFCGGGARVCGTAWTVAADASAVAAEPDVLRSCRDVDDITQGSMVASVCGTARAKCSNSTDAPAPECTDVKAIGSIWEVQRHIREHGSVVTRLNVNNPRNFTEFFEANRTAVFPGSPSCEDWPSCGQPFGHAITLIGYNIAMAWTALNSWGSDWADRGTFRIAYGIAGVGNAADTYSLVCRPADIQEQRARRLPLVRVNATCYTYTVDATRTPSLSSVAARFGVSIVQLVAGNPSIFPRVPHAYNGSWAVQEGGGAPECAATPNCDSATTEPECLLEVVNATDDSGTCAMTWLQPNLTVPLGGQQLLLCGVPAATFAGSPDGRFAGTAVAVCPAGQQPNDAGGCEACPPGTFKAQAGTDDCSICLANTIRTAADSPAGPCQACPGSGVTRPGGTAWDHDSEDDCGCPAGQTWSSSSSQCVTCPANTFKEQAGPGGCDDCLYGSLALGPAPGDHIIGTEDCSGLFTAIAVGDLTAWALAAAGSRLVCWGFNGEGESQLAAQRPSASWSAIAMGRLFSCGILAGSGMMVCSGHQEWAPISREHPSTKWAAVSAADRHVCAIAQGSRRLVCIGVNTFNQTIVPPAHRNASWAAVSTGGFFFRGTNMECAA